MKRLLSLVAFFATLQSTAQQINPVPDYVFRNQMSVGRNAVTDTAAYFSIGPRYGANKGFMPPIVGDTSTFSSGKRNGLLIFSVQKNKFLYWDSVGVKWAEMAGTGGSAITGSGVAGYMPEFTTATNIDTTRLYHSAGRFAIGSTTTTNGVFNVYGGRSYFDTSILIGTNTLFADEANERVGVGTTSPTRKFEVVQASGDMVRFQQSSGTHNGVIEFLHSNPNQSGTARHLGLNFLNTQGSARGLFHFYPSDTTTVRNYFQWVINSTEVMRIENDGKSGINATANLAALSVFNPVQNTSVLEVRGGGGSSQSRLRFTYGTSSSVTAENALIFSNTSEFSFRAGLNRVLSFYTNDGSDTERFRLFSNGRVFIGSSPVDNAYQLEVNGTAKAASLSTNAPSGGSIKPWKIGEAATVSPTSPNRTLRVEVDGVVYYIHAKTTND